MFAQDLSTKLRSSISPRVSTIIKEKMEFIWTQQQVLPFKDFVEGELK